MAGRFVHQMYVTREETKTAEASVADALLKVRERGREKGRKREREG